MPRWFYDIPNIYFAAVLVLISILGGCATYSQQESSVIRQRSIKPKLKNIEKVEVVPIPERLPCQRLYQDEIISLKQMLAEKDELIQHLNARELDQAQVLQDTASEISRAKNKLHRLATQPEAASKVAEVEVAMATLGQIAISRSEAPLQFLAQQLLDAATAAYAQKDYSGVMNYATQSHGLIDVVTGSVRKNSGSRDSGSSFSTPISLRITRNSYLHQDPNSDSKTIEALRKNTLLTGTAYRNDWFHVRTTDGLSGWVKNSVVGAQINNRDYEE